MSANTVLPLAESVAVGAASAQFALVMTVNRFYRIISTTACWLAQGANPTAVGGAGAGKMYLPAGVSYLISGDHGAKLAVIQDAAGGFAVLAPFQD